MKTKNLFPCLGVASRKAWACLGKALMRSRACLAVVPLRAGRSRVLPVLIAALGLIGAGRVTAQTFKTLHSFTAGSGSFPYVTNSDGANPYAGLILSGNTLYGTAFYGGDSGYGTVFAVNTDGTGFTNMYNFTAFDPVTAINSDGANPYAYNFTASPGGPNSDGSGPFAGLVSSGNTLYGTARDGGSSGAGTVFAVNTDGTGFTTLHEFCLTDCSDGVGPVSGLVLSGNILYGTVQSGGSGDFGTVFAVSTNGTGFTTLHSFTARSCYGCPNSDGANPYGGLILLGNTLYGTAVDGGSSGAGTVFALNTDGTGFTNLHSFTALSHITYGTNSDGGHPEAGLILSGNTLYGTAASGGSSGYGTVFAVSTNGTGFTTLYSFTAWGTNSSGGQTNSDGFYPRAGLILSGNTLYGTAGYGGSSGNGTVFSLSLPVPPQLTIIPSGPYVILTWPTNYTGFALQSTTNLVSRAVWTTNSPGPVVIGGQNVVVNTISGTQKFYRLIR